MVKAQNPARCPQCLMLVRLCICALIPRIESQTRLVVLMHHNERRKPTNTGMLAARCLAGSEIYVYGAEGHPLDYKQLIRADTTNLLLFPAEHAAPLAPEVCGKFSRPIRLIVPDGNWAQARRMGRKVQAEVPVINVTLRDGPPSQYGLRRKPAELPSGLATLEAIARALDVIEGPGTSEPLLEIFRIMVARTLWSKGKLPAPAVYRDLPPGE